MYVVNFIVENWFLIVFALVAIIFVTCSIIRFIHMPTAKQIENLMEWLKIAVVEAEKQFQSGTGQLKLRAVYESAVIAFPWIAKYMTFEKFSQLVDIALVWMREQIEQNEKIREYIEGNEKDKVAA
nr:MAG TPA: holin [Caudoviricetes sp.]